MDQSTIFSDDETIVLQIFPKVLCGNMQINGKEAPRICASVFIPDILKRSTISCPLNYFQDNVSLAEKWIINDSSQKIMLNNIDKLKRVIITIKTNDNENELTISANYSSRLLDYFKLDVNLNPRKYRGFDCYAFICFLANINYFPRNPEFEYIEKIPNNGNFIILTNGRYLPNSIKHWALYLGEN